jgi:hypothetical protein
VASPSCPTVAPVVARRDSLSAHVLTRGAVRLIGWRVGRSTDGAIAGDHLPQ